MTDKWKVYDWVWHQNHRAGFVEHIFNAQVNPIVDAFEDDLFDDIDDEADMFVDDSDEDYNEIINDND